MACREINQDLARELTPLLAIRVSATLPGTPERILQASFLVRVPRFNALHPPAVIKRNKSEMVANSLQGKVAELRQELNSGGKKDKNHSAKKIALKKIVANMTMSNNDMVGLFPDIIATMQTPSLEIKKM
jgi:hypothetical protein